jgi:uncharacterized protein (TIGR03067 family)
MRRVVVLVIVALLFECGCQSCTRNDRQMTQGPGAAQESIQGIWYYESIQFSGKPYPFKPGDHVVFNDNGIATWFINDERNIAKYVLDPSARPKRIDLHDLDSKGRPVGHGIYKLIGDTLYVCDTTTDNPRPTRFKTVEGDNYFYVVLKRR